MKNLTVVSALVYLALILCPFTAIADVVSDDFNDGIIDEMWKIGSGWGWDTGFDFEEAGGILNVLGTDSNPDGQHWGNAAAGPYGVTGDIDVSVNVMVPVATSATGVNLILIGTEAEVELELSPTGGYQMIVRTRAGQWVPGWLPLKGNETTQYNMLRLTYSVASSTFSAYTYDANGLNEMLIGSHVTNIGSQAGIQLHYWTQQGSSLDIRFDDFYISADPYPVLIPPPLAPDVSLGDRQAFQPGTDDILMPLFSDDGDRLAYLRRDDPDPANGVWNIYVKDLTTSDAPYRITENSDWVSAMHFFEWSPNGERIYFLTEPAAGPPQIRYVDATETTSRISVLYLNGLDGYEGIDFSRGDSPQAAYTKNSQLYTINVDGYGDPVEPWANERRITDMFYSGVYWPEWSPDGSKIACGFSTFGGATSIWVINDVYSIEPTNLVMDGFHSNVHVVTDYSNYVTVPHFSYDGEFLYYCQDLNGVFNPSINGWNRFNPVDVMLGNSNFDLFVASVDGSNPPERLNDDPYSQGIMSVSPDGTLIVYGADDNTDGDGVRDADIYIHSLVVSEDINTDGGDVSDGSGTTVDIPEGALEQEETITIETPLPGSEPPLDTLPEDTSLALARELGPDGLTFEVPVTIEIHYTDEEIAGLDEESLRIYYYDDEAEVWAALNTFSHDIDNNIIIAETYHFSIVGLLAVTTMSRIALLDPLNQEISTVPPTFVWTPNGGTDNVFAVDFHIPSLVPFWSTYEHGRILIRDSRWTMPAAMWNRVPTGTIFWRVRGADLDRAPLSLVQSGWWSFVK